jgi:hypothetical protein
MFHLVELDLQFSAVLDLLKVNYQLFIFPLDLAIVVKPQQERSRTVKVDVN